MTSETVWTRASAGTYRADVGGNSVSVWRCGNYGRKGWAWRVYDSAHIYHRGCVLDGDRGRAGALAEAQKLAAAKAALLAR